MRKDVVICLKNKNTYYWKNLIKYNVKYKILIKHAIFFIIKFIISLIKTASRNQSNLLWDFFYVSYYLSNYNLRIIIKSNICYKSLFTLNKIHLYAKSILYFFWKKKLFSMSIKNLETLTE